MASGLRALLYAGYYGESRLGGEHPGRVIDYLRDHFDVFFEYWGSSWPNMIRCLDESGRCRLLVQYLWDRQLGGWRYHVLPGRGRRSD